MGLGARSSPAARGAGRRRGGRGRPRSRGLILALPPRLFPLRDPLPRSRAEILTADIADNTDGNTCWQVRLSLRHSRSSAQSLQPSTGGPPVPRGVGVHWDSSYRLIP